MSVEDASLFDCNKFERKEVRLWMVKSQDVVMKSQMKCGDV